jgi:hypothetical protein
MVISDIRTTLAPDDVPALGLDIEPKMGEPRACLT